MTTDVQHAENYTAIRKPVPRYGILQITRGQSPTGYGKKIQTDYMIQFKDDARKIKYRVYCVCYSNVGSLYVIRNRQTLYLREYELEAEIERFDQTNTLEQGR